MPSITANIAGKKYPLKAQSEAEAALIDKAAKAINAKLLEYKTNFSTLEKQDYMAMALLYFAVESEKKDAPEIVSSIDEDIIKRLEVVDSFLDDILEALE